MKLEKIKIDLNVLKVTALLVAYYVVLVFIQMLLSSARGLPHTFGFEFFSRQLLSVIFVIASLLIFYLLAQWAGIIRCWRNPLDKMISALFTLLIVASTYILWRCAEAATWGQLDSALFAVAALLILTVAYCNNFLYSLSDTYAKEHQQLSQEKIRAERLKAELITNVSHDIQTPLTSIISYSDLLRDLSRDDNRDDDFDEKFREYTEVLERKSDRLKLLTKDLIEASKAATGNTAIDLQIVDLTELVWQVAGEFDSELQQKNLSFVFDPAQAAVLVSADPAQMWRILENLFTNMEKYSLAGTRTFARLDYLNESSQGLEGGHQNMVRLSLQNTSEQPLSQEGQASDDLTEQFMRGDKSRHSDGSGLGLHIAKSLAELMGGELTISASGDQFKVTLLLVGAGNE